MLEGFFSCKRGVRQSDHLSPLLFCIAKEVLTKGIINLTNIGKLKLIYSPRNFKTPSHCIYTYDIMLLSKCTTSNIHVLSNHFDRNDVSSSKYINPQKSTIYPSLIPRSKMIQIFAHLGFRIGRFPFIYIGVPNLKGKPISNHLLCVVDKMKTKLITWKSSIFQ